MRHLRLLALLAPALLLPAACEDPSSSSGGLTLPEAGAGFEAGSTDAAQPVADAAVDNFVPPVPKGITVTVTDAALPKADVRVLFHDATGAVISETKTNAAGKATSATAPSMVTVLTIRDVLSVQPVTFAGVADGDNLVVAVPAATIIEETPYAKDSVSFDFASPLVTNATNFGVYAGGNCYGSSTSARVAAVVDLYAGCVGAQNAVIATATNTNGDVVAFGTQKNLPKPAANATVAVGPLAFTAPGSTKVTATNLPAGVNVNNYGRLVAIANGASFDMNGSGTVETGGVTFSTATGFAEAYQSIVASQLSALGSASEKAFVRREVTTAPASANLATFDFANSLPFITNAALANPTPARPDITLTAAGSLTAADGGLATLVWSNPLDESSGTWLFVLPPGTTSFKVPALPANATNFVPTADVEVFRVLFFDATQLNGYKELKALPVGPSFGVDLIDQTKPLPAAGTLRITRWSSGQRG